MKRAIGLAVVVACGPVQAFEQSFERVAVADGIVAYVANESPGGVVQGNITVISGKDASLVIDSGQYPALARRVAADMRASRLPPAKFLLNTHWHGDHLLANFVFDEAFPGLVVLQHAETARLGPPNYGDWGPKKVEELVAYAGKMDTAAQKGVTSKGVKLDEDMRESFRVDARLIRAWAESSKESRWEAPDITLTADTGVDLGGRVVSLRHLGNANTTGDMVAWDAQTKTLVTGDIVVHPTPYSFGSWHSDWIDTLQKMRDLQPAHLVPGHGAVMQDDAYLALLQDLLAETRKQVRAAVDAGKTLDDVRKEITLAEFETRFAGDNVERRRAFRQFYLQPGLERAWKEARGEPLAE